MTAARTPPGPPRSGAGRKVLMAAAAALLGLGGLNLLALLVEVAPYGTWMKDGQPAGLYVAGPTDRPQLQPGARLRGLRYRISINSLGFRGPELAADKPADGFRLWCLGGSTTFDIYAPDDDATWCAVAGQQLRAAAPHRTVEVLNAGIPGEVIHGSVQDLERHGPTVRPDAVVIYHGPNDLRTLLVSPREMVSGPEPSPLQRLDVALVRVATRWLQGSGGLQVELPARQIRPEEVQQLRQRLERIVQATERLGATPVLATHALRAPPDAQGDEARRLVAEASVLLHRDAASTLAAFATWNELVTDLARKRDLPLADVRAVVGPEAENWGDATHFRAPGSALAGREVAETVLEAGLLEAR